MYLHIPHTYIQYIALHCNGLHHIHYVHNIITLHRLHTMHITYITFTYVSKLLLPLHWGLSGLWSIYPIYGSCELTTMTWLGSPAILISKLSSCLLAILSPFSGLYRITAMGMCRFAQYVIDVHVPPKKSLAILGIQLGLAT